MAAYLARPVCRPRAYALLVAGAFLPGGHAAVAAVTDGTLQLLLASEGPQEGEGQLDVVSEQPLFATARALARLPSGGAPPREEQVGGHGPQPHLQSFFMKPPDSASGRCFSSFPCLESTLPLQLSNPLAPIAGPAGPAQRLWLALRPALRCRAVQASAPASVPPP